MTLPAQTLTSDVQARITPDLALQLLMDGNERFVAGLRAERDLNEQVRLTSAGQYPFAVVQGCIDSRVPLEMVFDLGIGDIFASRTAGNVINGDQLGGMEYACKAAGAKLVVVLGHTHCGAVTGAVHGIEMGNLTGLLSKIRPAIAAVAPFDEVTPHVVNQVVEANVQRAVRRIRTESAVLGALERDGRIRIVGGIYDIETGVVRFLEA